MTWKRAGLSSSTFPAPLSKKPDAAILKHVSSTSPSNRKFWNNACGIAVASYGNQVLGQMPTGILVAVSVAALYLAPRLDA